MGNCANCGPCANKGEPGDTKLITDMPENSNVNNIEPSGRENFPTAKSGYHSSDDNSMSVTNNLVAMNYVKANNETENMNTIPNTNVNTEELKPKKTIIPTDPDFAMKLFQEFNMCRTHPAVYADKIERHKQYIYENQLSETGNDFAKYIYENTSLNGPKILLKDGPSKLIEFANILRNMEPLKEFKYNPDLCIPVPEKNSWTKKEVFSKLVKNKKLELKTNNISFHFDVGYADAETTAVLQLIDDNVFFKGKRRQHILGEKHLEIGITNMIDGRKNCCYITLLHNNMDRKNTDLYKSIVSSEYAELNN